VLAVGGGLMAAADAAERRPEAAELLDRLCSETLRANEEDRLYGLISLTVRSTIKYQDAVFSPDLIDDAVQDGLGALIDACPKLAATDDAHRLGLAIGLIRDATTSRIRDVAAGYSEKETQAASAADLSQELSAPEIDAWLDALPARQRALALFLYASDVKRDEIADAVGLPGAGLAIASRGVKADLLKFFRHQWESAPPPPIPGGPALEYREAGQALAALLAPGEAPREAPGEATGGAALTPAAAAPTVRITGISSEIYAGWSLLARVTGLPADRSLELAAPILLEPDKPGRRRMIAVALDEISDPHDATRRFLVKAFAIDADKDGSGLRDGFRLSTAAIDNSRALETIRNRTLATIEIARCLWHDYGAAPDPGLCR
jgi:hypothetical protein